MNFMLFAFLLAIIINSCYSEINSVCLQPKEIGPCKGAFRNFYFNPDSASCEVFLYGGCNGNENRFLTLEQCQNRCLTNSKKVKRQNSICAQPQDVGPCKAAFKRYHFNADTQKCEPFIYGGCGGNDNNFLTEDICQRKCI